MSEAVLVALITGACAIAAQFIISRASAKELYAKLDKQSEVTDEKIKGRIDVLQADLRTLSNRVDAHNRVVERTFQLERRADVLEEKAKAANRRIDDLERNEKI
ncbi:MAG: hypothetical protein IKO07_00925 [Clostridia bacterium]|nr:hypothetical protein [Clostridia bacterium]